ncbi:lyase family protein [Lacisediminihabitans sp. FW035]
MRVRDWGLLDPLATPGVDDDAVLAALVEVERALMLAWHDIGDAPDLVAEVSFEVSHLDLGQIARGNRDGGNPVIPLVAQLRTQAEASHAGAGDWVHRGATSQDILDSALMLVATRAIGLVSASLADSAERLVVLAETHRHSLMVGRTLTQHAAPITFGVKAASWLDGVEAARASLDALALPVQLAGAVGTGTAFADLGGSAESGPRLRAALAGRLGLADPERSWQAERSIVATLASALSLVIGCLGRVATDALVLARTEIGELSEGSAGASSAMPQKRNPTAAVLVRSAALQAPGLLATVFSSLATEDERPAGAWHAEWLALRSLLRIAVESSAATAVFLSALSVDTQRMRATVDSDGGLAWAEHATSQLVPDLGRAAAAVVVARAIELTTADLSFGAALAAELDGRVVDLSPESIHATADLIVDAALARYQASRHQAPPHQASPHQASPHQARSAR